MLLLLGIVEAFVGPVSSRRVKTLQQHRLFAEENKNPILDKLFGEKQKTIDPRTLLTQEQIEEPGYSLLGSLSREGPIPVFVRVFQPNNYRQAVEKFMLEEKVSRIEAMANMDNYFNDPLGWQVRHAKYKKTGIKTIDYVNSGQGLGPLALTVVWGTVSSWFIWRIYQYTFLGIDYKDNFWGF